MIIKSLHSTDFIKSAINLDIIKSLKEIYFTKITNYIKLTKLVASFVKKFHTSLTCLFYYN